MEKIYRFDESLHLHQLKVKGVWKSLTGCTTVLGVIAKPALIAWSSKMATEYIKNNAPMIEDNDVVGYFVTEDVLQEAKNAHNLRKTDAGCVGTKIHKDISNIIEKAIKESKGKIPKKIKVITPAEKAFCEWAIYNDIKFLETEKNVYSKKMFTGGIIDIIFELDKKIWIGDIKTSKSGIYPENFFQCAGYDLMLSTMSSYKEIEGYVILNIKENGSFTEKRKERVGNHACRKQNMHAHKSRKKRGHHNRLF